MQYACSVITNTRSSRGEGNINILIISRPLWLNCLTLCRENWLDLELQMSDRVLAMYISCSTFSLWLDGRFPTTWTYVCSDGGVDGSQIQYNEYQL